MDDGTTLRLRPAGTGFLSAIQGKGVQNGMMEDDIPGAFVEGSKPVELSNRTPVM